jgi:hypothetical protein
VASNLWVTAEELGSYGDSTYAYDACKTASYLLWGMSGRKYSGTTTVTEKYISSYDPYLRMGASAKNYQPVLVDGHVENVRSDGFGRFGEHDFMGDGTSSTSRLRLRGRKVIKIHNMRDQFGKIISPSKYYLSEHSTIIATPGANWSSSNVEVTYTYGTPPPTAGKAAARILAIELVKLYEGDDTCALPQRVTSVSRQGVSYTLLDSQDFIDELRTGIYAIDLFLKTSNPDRARARARVFSPDVPKARRITPHSLLLTPTASDLQVFPTGGSLTLYFDEIGGDFLLTQDTWTIFMSVSDYTEAKTAVIANAVTLDVGAELISLYAPYQDVYDVLGIRDPGTYEIYCTRPSPTNSAVEEVVTILSANISISLATRVEPIYTP